MHSRASLVVLRWIARAASLVSLGILLLFLFGEGFDPARLTARGWLLFAFFPVGVSVGMILGWRRELLGGLVTLSSLVAFYGAHLLATGGPPVGSAFAVLAAPGALFILSGWPSAGPLRPGDRAP